MSLFDTPIELVDTFPFLGIIVKFNNTFQTIIKNNADKTKKELHNKAVNLGKIELEVETQLHLFGALIKSIFLYGCEVWRYENVSQRNF